MLLDRDDDKAMEAFRYSSCGIPLLGSPTNRLDTAKLDSCSLHTSDGTMYLAVDSLESSCKRVQSIVLPLTEKIANLMTEVTILSGRDAR